MTLSQKILMVAFWACALGCDLYAPENPPPEPIQIGKQAWELG